MLTLTKRQLAAVLDWERDLDLVPLAQLERAAGFSRRFGCVLAYRGGVVTGSDLDDAYRGWEWMVDALEGQTQ